MVIGSPGAGSSRPASVSPQGPSEKRARPNEDGSGRGGGTETVVLDEEVAWEAGTGDEGTDGETRVPAREVPWAPEVRHYTGRLIHHADSAAGNLGTAFGLLRSTILPKDARTIKGRTEDLTGEIAQALLSVSSCVSLFTLVLNLHF